MAFKITPWVALIVFALIIVFSVVIAFYMQSYKNFDKSRIRVFTATLAGLGIIVTMLFYYSIVSVQQQQQQLTTIQETARIFNDVNNTILNEIKESSEFIPNFTSSILPLILCNIDLEPDQYTSSNCTRKYILSYKIFTVWQDVGLSQCFIQVEPEAYISGFLQQANSIQLFEQWKVINLNFNNKTKRLGALLFEYGLSIEEQTKEEYIKTANKLIKDTRFLDLL
jgi:heme/copper-type cytochrome/quinol oxidase subunit 4